MSENTPVANEPLNGKKFEGDGMFFKGKLIGMEDLSVDRNEKVCLDSMFKLKAVVKARGEHKQRIQIQLATSGVKIIDEITKAQVVSHEIERISFVVVDPRDTRAFGYIFNTADDRHQFWAIKTEKTAAGTVLALKELFDIVFQQFTKAEKAKLEAVKSVSGSPAPVKEAIPDLLGTPLPAPEPIPVVSPTNSAILDGDLGITPTKTATTTTNPISGDLWDVNVPPIPMVPPAPKPIDTLEDLLGLAVEPPVSTNPVLNFPSSPPVPAPSLPLTNPYAQFYSPTKIETNPFSATSSPPIVSQQTYPQRIAPPPPLTTTTMQQNILSPRSMSTSNNNPFSGLEFLGNLSSSPATRPTKESFFTNVPPPKTIQQLQMEKQLYPFNRS